MKLTEEERDARVRRLLEKEAADPERFFWMSFASEKGFLGVCIVLAKGPVSAAAVSHALGCNPGGEAAIIDLRNTPAPDAKYVARLLTREEAEAAEADLIAKRAAASTMPGPTTDHETES